MTAPRAALYARVSTDEQSPDLQVEELSRLAEQRGWSVAGKYVDHGISGAKESRPALDRLLAEVVSIPESRAETNWTPHPVRLSRVRRRC